MIVFKSIFIIMMGIRKKICAENIDKEYNYNLHAHLIKHLVEQMPFDQKFFD